MSEVKEYKCPSCGAPMYYDVKQESMSCKFCKNTFDIEYIRSHFNDKDNKGSDFDWVKRSKAVWEPYVSDKIEEFDCPSCGGQIITLSSTGTAKCPFCSHNVIISSDFQGDIRPDKIIPFRISKKEFEDRYMEYVSDIKNVPKFFKSKNALANIMGCYIPVWGYSCTCESVVDSKFNSSITVMYYPILANDKNMGWNVFYSMWPFNFNEADDFNESYLTGFYASRYTIGAENAMRDADYRVKETCPVKKLKSDTYTSEPDIKKIIHNKELTYYLVPVWLLNITYEKENYTIAMNGQTGKMCADSLPNNPLYHRLYIIIYLILQLAEFAAVFLYFKPYLFETEINSEIIGIIVMIILACIFFPLVFNVMVSSLICKILFFRNRKKPDSIKKNRYFYVSDFLE
ncbi:hypothetical protein [Ruminococcus sp.]|uniref:hypothetical protein n=1 Tax=Ruminococcus sp. TaxID=41978 RepID=UPI0025E1B517|nr:hypothetical protein [Ruminococcus sp.]